MTSTKAYLKRYIASLPKNGRGEVTRLAKALRVSTTLMSQILSGSKNLTPEQTQSLIQYLGLAGLEADYLLFLVQFERAGSEDLRQVWKNKLEQTRHQSLKLSARVSTHRTLSDADRAVFYSSAMYSAVRLYTSTHENGRTLTDVVERFGLSRAKTSEILRFLTEAGLCEQKDERYFLGAKVTHLEQGSPHLPKHHTNWRLRGIQQNENLSEHELMYTAPISVSRADFIELREEMVQWIQRFVARVQNSPAEDVACFNLDFFWLRKQD